MATKISAAINFIIYMYYCVGCRPHAGICRSYNSNINNIVIIESEITSYTDYRYSISKQLAILLNDLPPSQVINFTYMVSETDIPCLDQLLQVNISFITSVVYTLLQCMNSGEWHCASIQYSYIDDLCRVNHWPRAVRSHNQILKPINRSATSYISQRTMHTYCPFILHPIQYIFCPHSPSQVNFTTVILSYSCTYSCCCMSMVLDS